jgi:uncharacterized membrane protein YidH (DUF202 family)
MTDSKMTRPSNGLVPLIVGAVLLIIGIAAMVQFGFGTPGPDSTGAHVAWETGLTIGAAAAAGVGLLLIAIGIVKRTRMKAQDAKNEPRPRTSGDR